MCGAWFPKRTAKSVYGFDFAEAYRAGKRGILFDIDNTLVAHDYPAEPRCNALFRQLRELGFQVMILSNNSEPRVRDFTAESGVPYIYKAGKPKRGAYLAACAQMGLSADEVLFFGDQIFTDIWGANRAGVESVLVEPIDRSTDIKKIRLKRVLERPVLWAYRKMRGNAADK